MEEIPYKPVLGDLNTPILSRRTLIVWSVASLLSAWSPSLADSNNENAEINEMIKHFRWGWTLSVDIFWSFFGKETFLVNNKEYEIIKTMDPNPEYYIIIENRKINLDSFEIVEVLGIKTGCKEKK